MNASFLQDRIAYRKIDGKNLFIVPDLPSWVVLTDDEAILFRYLVDGQSEGGAVEKGIEAGVSTTQVDSVLVSLLTKLRDRHIFPAPETTWQAPDATHYGRNIHLCLTHRCNLRCRHCYVQAGVLECTELDLVQWKKAFSRLMATVAAPDITISGGEPTVFPYFPQLVEYLHEAGARLTLYTNGTQDVRELLPYLDGVQVSLEGLSAETHDYIRGGGVFAKVREFIDSLTEKDKLSVALTLMAHNFDEVTQELQPFLAEIGLPRNNVRLNADLEYDGRATSLPEEFHSFLKKRGQEVFAFVHDFFPAEPRTILRNMRNCGIGISMGIDSNGDIYPCDVFENKSGNVFDSDLQIILDRLLALNRDTEIQFMPKCDGCDIRLVCLGGCRAKNFRKTGCYCEPICDADSRHEKYLRMVYDVGV